MIITENREKVKRQIKSLVNRGNSCLSKPEKKFILEMVLGMLMTGSSNITEIARSLKESISVKDTSKRLHRMLNHSKILDYANACSLQSSKTFVDNNTILALDGGDLSHHYGKKFENLQYVKDGSTGKTEPGYWLNQVTGYNSSTHSTFPIYLDVYSTLEKGFKSANAKSLNIVSNVLNVIGNKGLWVLDRGYDNGEILDYFFKKQLNFCVRMKVNRNLYVKDKKINILKIAQKINRRIKFSTNARFGSKKLHISLKGKKHEATLICYKDRRNKEPVIWLVNGWIKSTKELKRRINGYFRRWSVEEAYRFEKQGFGIESATVRKYSKTKTLVGLTILSWLVLSKLNRTPLINEALLISAKMEKNKTKNKPQFIYYRLLKGVQNLFKEAKEIFRFRATIKERNKIKKNIEEQGALFPDILMNLRGLVL